MKKNEKKVTECSYLYDNVSRNASDNGLCC